MCSGKWRRAFWWICTDISEEPTAFIMSARDGGGFLRNVGTYLRIQDITYPKKQFCHTNRRRDVKCHGAAVVYIRC